VSIEVSIMINNELERIEVVSIVNYDGIGFVRVSVFAENGDVIVGLLKPDGARDLGNACFTEAEIADVDNILYQMMINSLDLDEDVVSDFIIEFKKAREES